MIPMWGELSGKLSPVYTTKTNQGRTLLRLRRKMSFLAFQPTFPQTRAFFYKKAVPKNRVL